MKTQNYIKQPFIFLWAWFAIFMVISFWQYFYHYNYTLLVLLVSAAGYIVGFAYLANWIKQKGSK